VSSAGESGVVAPISGLSHFQLLVSDVEASARWYTSVLSLVPYAQDLAIGYVALRQPAANVVLVLTTRPGGDDAATGSGADALDHVAFAVADGDALRDWAAHLTALGIDHDGIVLENGRPSLQLRDPDGIAIELVA
jgi:glyoxylase I family protein